MAKGVGPAVGTEITRGLTGRACNVAGALKGGEFGGLGVLVRQRDSYLIIDLELCRHNYAAALPGRHSAPSAVVEKT